MKKLRALWHLLFAKKYCLYVLTDNGAYRNFRMEVGQAERVISDLQDNVSTACHQHYAVSEAQEIVNGG